MKHPIYKTVADNIKALMKEKKVYGYQLAEVAGLSVTHMSEIFSGTRYLRLHSLIEIAKFLKVKPEYLMNEAKNNPKSDYIPYGDKWRKDMMKWPKRVLLSQFKISNSGQKKSEIVEEIRKKLIKDNSINY